MDQEGQEEEKEIILESPGPQLDPYFRHFDQPFKLDDELPEREIIPLQPPAPMLPQQPEVAAEPDVAAAPDPVVIPPPPHEQLLVEAIQQMIFAQQDAYNQAQQREGRRDRPRRRRIPRYYPPSFLEDPNISRDWGKLLLLTFLIFVGGVVLSLTVIYVFWIIFIEKITVGEFFKKIFNTNRNPKSPEE